MTYTGIAVGLVLNAGAGHAASALLAAVSAGAVWLAIALLSRGMICGGDVTLAAMIDAWLGWPGGAAAPPAGAMDDEPISLVLL